MVNHMGVIYSRAVACQPYSSAVFTEYRACLLKHVASIVSSNDWKRADCQGGNTLCDCKYSNGPKLDVALPVTAP